MENKDLHFLGPTFLSEKIWQQRAYPLFIASSVNSVSFFLPFRLEETVISNVWCQISSIHARPTSNRSKMSVQVFFLHRQILHRSLASCGQVRWRWTLYDMASVTWRCVKGPFRGSCSKKEQQAHGKSNKKRMTLSRSLYEDKRSNNRNNCNKKATTKKLAIISVSGEWDSYRGHGMNKITL